MIGEGKGKVTRWLFPPQAMLSEKVGRWISHGMRATGPTTSAGRMADRRVFMKEVYIASNSPSFKFPCLENQNETASLASTYARRFYMKSYNTARSKYI